MSSVTTENTEQRNQEGGNIYLGVELQAKEMVRKAVSLLSQPRDDGLGKVVLISGGTRVGKTTAIEGENGIRDQLTALGKERIEYYDVDDLESLLSRDKREIEGKIFLPKSDEALMQAVIESGIDYNTGKERPPEQDGINRISKCCDLAREKGVNLVLSLGLNAEQFIFPKDFPEEERELMETSLARGARVERAFEMLASQKDISILFLDRDPNKVFRMLKDIARSDSYRFPPDPDEMGVDFVRSMALLELQRELSIYTYGPAFQQIMEKLGTENPDGDFSRVAEKEAREIFKAHFQPPAPSRNDLPKRPEISIV